MKQFTLLFVGSRREFAYITIVYFSLSLTLFPVAPTLEHRTSVKRFVSLQFLNPNTVGRTRWTGDRLVARTLPTQIQNQRRHPCLEWDSNPKSQCSNDRLRRRGHCDQQQWYITLLKPSCRNRTQLAEYS
jgi:hypothetical protein